MTATRLETKDHERFKKIAKKNSRSIAGELKHVVKEHIEKQEGKK
jgi:hypothetical protein